MVEMSVQISIDYWECHLQGEKGGDVCCKKQSRHVFPTENMGRNIVLALFQNSLIAISFYYHGIMFLCISVYFRASRKQSLFNHRKVSQDLYTV